jgi:hypothetical protein
VKIALMGADIPARTAGGTRPDDELVAAARQGDTAELKALLMRYQPNLYRFGRQRPASEVPASAAASVKTALRAFLAEP